MVSTHLKNISQNGNLPQIGVKIKNIWNHHSDINSLSSNAPSYPDMVKYPKRITGAFLGKQLWTLHTFTASNLTLSRHLIQCCCRCYFLEGLGISGSLDRFPQSTKDSGNVEKNPMKGMKTKGSSFQVKKTIWRRFWQIIGFLEGVIPCFSGSSFRDG